VRPPGAGRCSCLLERSLAWSTQAPPRIRRVGSRLLGAGPPSSCSGNQQRRHRRGAVEVGTAFAHHAYRLFLERARERRRGWFRMPTQKPPSLTSAARVDHLPLGIELAAARRASCRWMNCPSLEGHLGEWAQPRQRTPAHHRSVRAAVEWSSTLLDPVEQGRISESGGVCRRIRCRGRLRRRPPAFRLPCWPVLWICRWSQWFRCGGNDVGDCSDED
jgi:hypothetical protein